jgi:hypothetical protein
LAGGPAAAGQPAAGVSLITSSPTARVALINKSTVRACEVELTVPGAAAGASAELHSLISKGGLASSYAIFWKGQTFSGARDGLPRGQLHVPRVAPRAASGAATEAQGAARGGGAYVVRVPAGQAALLIVPLAVPLLA